MNLHVVSSNGLWEFQLGSGFDEDVPFGVTLNQTILVPFPLESCLSGAFQVSRPCIRQILGYLLASPWRMLDCCSGPCTPTGSGTVFYLMRRSRRGAPSFISELLTGILLYTSTAQTSRAMLEVRFECPTNPGATRQFKCPSSSRPPLSFLGYDAFSVDVTSNMKASSNELILAVYDPSDEGYQGMLE